MASARLPVSRNAKHGGSTLNCDAPERFRLFCYRPSVITIAGSRQYLIDLEEECRARCMFLKF